jgi:hypothetical protein
MDAHRKALENIIPDQEWRTELPSIAQDVWHGVEPEDTFSFLSRFLAKARANPEIIALEARVDDLARTVERHDVLLSDLFPPKAAAASDIDHWLQANPDIMSQYRGKHLAIQRQSNGGLRLVAAADTINELYSILTEQNVSDGVIFRSISVPSI